MSLTIQNPNLPPPAFAMTPRALSQITDYIIHHEAGPITETPQEVDSQHRAEGWSMCGYNYIIDQSGIVWECRPLDVVPSAAYGRNTQSVNVSLVGNFQVDDPGYTGPPTDAQLTAIVELGVYLHRQLPSIERTIGHRDVATMFYGGDGNYATACPGSQLYAQLPALKAKIASFINPPH
jgi:N-acetylmuramoyl-L-alanine amidase